MQADPAADFEQAIVATRIDPVDMGWTFVLGSLALKRIPARHGAIGLPYMGR
jgi:hypothetical protein